MSPLAGVPFTVTAWLQQGAALDARFGIALDGLLASQIREARKRLLADEPLTGGQLDGGLHVPDPLDVPLPLASCTQAGEWHWMATTAQPVDFDGNPVVPDLDVHHVNGRLDHRRAEVIALHVPKTLSSTSGRYRSRRLPVVTVPAAALVWRAVGDADTVRALLQDLPTVGARRGTGEGTVRSWEVTADPRGNVDQYGHLHPDGRLGRPVPTACAARLTVRGVGEGVAGLRPPYWHHSRQHLLVLPGYGQKETA